MLDRALAKADIAGNRSKQVANSLAQCAAESGLAPVTVAARANLERVD